MAKYKVKRNEIDRVINNINSKKEARIKPKIKPKRLRNFIVKSATKGTKLAVKKRIKKLKEKTKKNLRENETTESDSIVNTIGAYDKTTRTLDNTKQGVKVLRKVKKFATTKSIKPKIKIKKSKLNGKINNDVLGTNNRKIKFKSKGRDVSLNSKGRLKLKIKKNSLPIQKGEISAKKIKFKKLSPSEKNRIKLKVSKSNISKRNIRLTKNRIRFKKVSVSNLSSNGNIANNKGISYLERKKQKKYSRIEKEKRKVSNLDTSTKDNTFRKLKQSEISDSSKNTYLLKEKNNKLSKKTKANKQAKKKYITNKSAYKKMANKQSKQAVKQTAKASKQLSKKLVEKTARATAKVVAEVLKVVGKAVASLLSNPYVLAVIGIIVTVIIIVNVISLVFVGIVGKSPNADNDTMVYLSEQLVILDNEDNEYIENLAEEENIECDEVNYIYNSPKEFMQSSLKEFIIYLMILDNNTITKDSIETLKVVHEQSYLIETELVQGEGEDGESIQILEVSLTIYTFTEMLGILGFSDEEIERANQIMELPFNEIYNEINFNEAGKGLTQAEIDELMKDLPSSTPNREKIRETAFTLVDYTVYDWGGKASGTVARPTGLDCSGFVAWVYDRAGFTKSLQGGGTSYQWGISTSSSYSQIEVGDLGFQHDPTKLSNQGYNHVGIYIGNGLWIECYSSHGVGVTSGNAFKLYRKVNDFNE